MASSSDTPREPETPADGTAPSRREGDAAAPADPAAGSGDTAARPDSMIEDAEIVSETGPDDERQTAEAETDAGDPATDATDDAARDPAAAGTDDAAGVPEVEETDRGTSDTMAVDGVDEPPGHDTETEMSDAEAGFDAPRDAGGSTDGDTDSEADAEARADGETDGRDDAGGAVGTAALGAAGLGAAAGAAATGMGRSGGDDGRDDTRRAEPPRAPAERPRRGGAVPLVVGGVIAAAIGAGALWWLDDRGVVTLSAPDLSGIEAQIAAQSTRLGTLEADLGALAERVETLPAAIETAAGSASAAGAAAAAADDRAADLEAALADLNERFTALEALPIAADPEAQALLQGYRDEMAGLRSDVAALTERASQLVSAAEEARARAEEAEGALDAIAAEAAAAEASARARAALRQLEGAFTYGGPFGMALAEIAAAGIAVPGALEALAADGVPTLAELREDFPPAAREALQIALRDVQDEPFFDRMTAFLRLQFGMRSISPREGDDADAVLSRAEAALASGDLETALAEVARLPDGVRAPLESWVAEVETRRTGAEALATLAAQVESL